MRLGWCGWVVWWGWLRLVLWVDAEMDFDGVVVVVDDDNTAISDDVDDVDDDGKRAKCGDEAVVGILL